MRPGTHYSAGGSAVNQHIKKFLLVRDNNQCCFGDLSQVKYFDQMAVNLTGPLTLDYSHGAVPHRRHVARPTRATSARGAPGIPTRGRPRRMSATKPIGVGGVLAAAGAAGCDGASSRASPVRVSPLTTATSRAADPAPPAAVQAVSTTSPRTAIVPSAAATHPQRPLPPPDAAGFIETSFDDVKFAMQKTDLFVESMLTDRVRSLFGQRIRIRGYMYPTPRKRGLKQFVLVRDNMECCFGPGAALFDCVMITMAEGATAEYSNFARSRSRASSASSRCRGPMAGQWRSTK